MASAMLGVAREAWENAGYRVHGVALSGIAADNLESGSGIASRTIASLEHQWAKDRDLLSHRDVLVVDEAGMIGTRQLERIVGEAQRRGAKVVLVGDPEQLQAIEAGAAFRSVAERHGAIEITEIRRQRDDWQRLATRQLATGRTAEAVHAYAEHRQVHAAATRDDARAALIERWDRDRQDDPQATRVILTHTNDEVRALNLAARERLRDAGELGRNVPVQTERGSRSFASGDRVMFLQNERSLGVKNGTLGTIDSVTSARMAVLLDDGRAVALDVKDYSALDHGYAATVHKAQGVTVDRVHVLATPGLDRHAAYVALSRQRDRVDLHYGADDFADERRLVQALSRDRGKDMASDYVRVRAPVRASQISEPGLRKLDPTPAAQPLSLHNAVVQYAKTTNEIMQMRRQGLDELPDQTAAFVAANHSLNGVRPDGARDLRAAFVRDMGLLDDASGGNSRGAIAAMDWERRYRTDPQLRADQFIQSWRQLGDRHELFERRGEDGAMRGVATQMAGLAKSLERDPQVESLLRQRYHDLGIPPYIERPLAQALPDWIGFGRGRGLGR